MKYLYFLFLSLLPSLIYAQVTTEPSVVIHDQPVTIFYDATQGTSGLQGATTVYMHAGVITENSANNSDWKYVQGNWGKDDGIGQMEKVAGEDNLWKISMESPRAYFGVPADEKILKIGMVFRNADGSKEGKNDQNGDIFVEVHNGYAATFSQPSASYIFVQSGASLTIAGDASSPSDIRISQNGVIIHEFTSTTSFSFPYTFSGSGSEEFTLTATDGSNTVSDTFTAIYQKASPIATLPAGLEQGLTVQDANTASFVLSAPGKESVYLIGAFSGWQPDPAYLMNRDGDLFWISLGGLNPEQVYSYYYLVDQEIDIADPYSELVLDKGNDQYIDASRFPAMPDFPAEAATDRLSVFSTSEAEYQWQTTSYVRPKVEDLVIYELLVRDFTAEESFQGVIDKLEYLDSLNITAIQLMPIMEFNGNESWGYNPTFQTALDKWYGTKNKFKELVDKAHARGMAVILDIALNHQDFPAPFLKMWSQGYGASAENPYFNVTAKHPYNVFSDVNHESTLSQAWVDRVNRYWLEEYKVDGFRFDLSKGFTQVNSGSDVGAWSAYDASRIALLKRMADEIRTYDPNAYIILEHFADNSEEKELADYGMLLWGNMNHNFGEAIMGYNMGNSQSSFSGLSYQARGWNSPHLVGYMESHDEERLTYKALTYGAVENGYSTKELSTALDRMKMASAFMLLTPGPKMIWQFGELGYDVSIDEGGRLSKKPLKWDYLDDPKRAALFRTISELNYLKTTYPVFETSQFSMPANSSIRSLRLEGDDMDVVLVGNFGLQENSAAISFTHTGNWYGYFSNDTLSVSSGDLAVSLKPGEFHLYLDKPLFYRGSDNPLAAPSQELSSQITLYPNPHSQGQLWLNLPERLAGQTLHIRLRNLQGQAMALPKLPAAGQKRAIQLPELTSGIYMLEIQSGKSLAVKRLIVE